MATLRIRMFDADRARLKDRVDLDVTDLGTMASVRHDRDVSGTATVRVSGLKPGRQYRIQVFPFRHRPVGVVARATDVRDEDVDVFCPVHPDRATAVFPRWSSLAPQLRQVLDRSSLEDRVETGQALYENLDAVASAGLLNLFSKMQHTVAGGATMWSFVNDVYRVRGDRIFANVKTGFRDHIRSAASGGDFERADDKLHTPPPGFTRAGSFKHQLFPAGGLQLTFFASESATGPAGPPSFRVDADIDDAAGLGHVFQVLRNFIGDRDTHPFDIHQILTFHQRLAPGYKLKV